MQEAKVSLESEAGGVPSQTSEASSQGTGYSTAEKAFIGAGALICGGIGYYVWNNRRSTSTYSHQVASINDGKHLGGNATARESMVTERVDNKVEKDIIEKTLSVSVDGEAIQSSPQATREKSNELGEGDLKPESSNSGGTSLQMERKENDENEVTVDPTPMIDLFGEVFGADGAQKDDGTAGDAFNSGRTATMNIFN